MTNLRYPEDVNAENEKSLQTLVRAIRFSQGEFSLILVRCNYAALRDRFVQRLRQASPVAIREITLPASAFTLYTNILAELADEHPSALMVFGLESVNEIDRLLTSSKYVREEFRKNFPFPMLLWVNDLVLQKLNRLATDFANWATRVEFSLTTNELSELLYKKGDAVFAGYTTSNLQASWELTTARHELQNRGQILEPTLQASLEFVLGLYEYRNDNLEAALEYYQHSLVFWQQNHNLQRKGILLLHIALAYYSKAKKNYADNQYYWEETRNYLQQGLDALEQAQCLDLVAQHISQLGGVLRRLQAWEDLHTLAGKSLTLHQNYGTPLQVAQDYGFLAEVALERSQWHEANQLAQQAVQILGGIANLQTHYYGWYLFLLARSQEHIGQVAEVVSHLERAREQTNPQYDPQLYINILKKLRDIYYQQGQYLEAFRIKQQCISIEHQYSFRAFIGAGYLSPQREVINPALGQVQKLGTIAQEISASGRQQDIDRLLERIANPQHKLTVIHGQSGVGKSSILQAGLVPALQQQAINARDVLPIVLRVYTDWVGTLGGFLLEALKNVETRNTKSLLMVNSTTAIIEQLRKNADRSLLTVLIFDQFEEFFFVYTDLGKRRSFYEFLRVCLDIPFVKVILSLREDYLHYLLELDRLFNLTVINNNILDKNIRYYLGNFSPKDAQAVVQSLTNRSRFYLEPELIDKLILDLAGDLGEVRPIELQIVGAQLQTDKITTLHRYQQFGTKEKLVERFLEEVIQDCGSNEQAARTVLYLLTNENGTRPLKTRAELAEDLVEANKLDLVLEIFVKSGLVLLLPEKPENLYQLVHDYLVSFIRQQQGNKLLVELEWERQQHQLTEERLNRVVQANQILAAAQQQAKREPLEQQIKIWWLILFTFIKAISITGFVFVLRLYGLLQPLELRAYDQMLRSRPYDEGPDPRLLVVTISDTDIAFQRQRGERLDGKAISDESLKRLLEKLQQYKPRAIGLDLYRDFEAQHPDLKTHLAQVENFVGICKGSDATTSSSGIQPPPEIPEQRLGFSDVVVDTDRVIRRHLLFMKQEDKSPCPASYALSMQLAFQYLNAEGIEIKFNNEGNLQLNKTVFPRLQPRTGGYQGIDANGGQVLLNYRSTKNIAEQVTLSRILSTPINPNAVKDRIVLIGVKIKDLQDYSATPYGTQFNEQMSGVLIHAHMVSQILSAVLDGRPLMQVLPELTEWLWILGWALVGASLSLVFWRRRFWKGLPLSIFIAMTVLAGSCYLAFSIALWLPLIPAIVTLLGSIIPMPIEPSYPLNRLRFQRTLELILEAYGENLADARPSVEYLINSTLQKKVVVEVLENIIIDALSSCQTVESIAGIANQLAWIPSPPLKALDSILPFLRISKGVEAALDTTSVYSQRELLESSVTALRHLQTSLVPRMYNIRKGAIFRSIAERWLFILNFEIDDIIP